MIPIILLSLGFLNAMFVIDDPASWYSAAAMGWCFASAFFIFLIESKGG